MFRSYPFAIKEKKKKTKVKTKQKKEKSWPEIALWHGCYGMNEISLAGS